MSPDKVVLALEIGSSSRGVIRLSRSDFCSSSFSFRINQEQINGYLYCFHSNSQLNKKQEICNYQLNIPPPMKFLSLSCSLSSFLDFFFYLLNRISYHLTSTSVKAFNIKKKLVMVFNIYVKLKTESYAYL